MANIRDGLQASPLYQNIPRIWGGLALISVLKFSAGSFRQSTKSTEHCFGKFGFRSELCSCSCSPNWNLELLKPSWGEPGEHEGPPVLTHAESPSQDQPLAWSHIVNLGELLMMLVIRETDLKSVMLLYTINQFSLLSPLKSVKTLKKFLPVCLCDHIKATEMLSFCTPDSSYFKEGSENSSQI